MSRQSKAEAWIDRHVPDQNGRVFVVTGANSGIGFETVRALARRRAHVVMACRNAEKAERARTQLCEEVPDASLECACLDLASLASVRTFAADLLERHAALDVLCNNAGVMAIPRRSTQDNFEMQLGTNHLGHFALTGLLLPALLRRPGSRIVTLSSMAHRGGRIRFEDLHWDRARYSKWGAYGQSKLANLLFTHELQRRLTAAGSSTLAVACHPGYAATQLQAVGPRESGSRSMAAVMALMNRLLAQSAEMGALPTLYAATSEEMKGGEYVGPGGFAEQHGLPRKVGSSSRSRNRNDAARLWEISELQTGVKYEAPAG